MTLPDPARRTFAPLPAAAPPDVVVLNWPLLRGEPSAWGAVLLALAAVAALAWLGVDRRATLLAAVALAVALWRSYLPVRWEIGLTGATHSLFGWRRRIPWIAIAKFELRPDGVWLFADRAESPLRGVFVFYDGRREAIVACIEYYLGAWTSSADASTEELPAGRVDRVRRLPSLPPGPQAMRLAIRPSLLLLAFFAVPAFGADDIDPPFEKWEGEIGRIEKRYAESAAPKGGVVFVGSSSIRLWDLPKSFPDVPLVNHGFGGSHLADSVLFFDRLVTPFEPRLVVLYAGDNDLKAGKTPERVHHDFQAFVKLLKEKTPRARFVYLPVKPCPSRWSLFETQRKTNELIRATIAEQGPGFAYLDTVTPMLDAGQPRPELFVKDMLHMNADGYAIWAKLLQPHIAAALKDDSSRDGASEKK